VLVAHAAWSGQASVDVPANARARPLSSTVAAPPAPRAWPPSRRKRAVLFVAGLTSSCWAGSSRRFTRSERTISCWVPHDQNVLIGDLGIGSCVAAVADRCSASSSASRVSDPIARERDVRDVLGVSCGRRVAFGLWAVISAVWHIPTALHRRDPAPPWGCHEPRARLHSWLRGSSMDAPDRPRLARRPDDGRADRFGAAMFGACRCHERARILLPSALYQLIPRRIGFSA